MNAALIEKYRDINVYDGWWDGVYEEFRDRMATKGVRVYDINFSGFHCQGSGACFSGHIHDWMSFTPEIYDSAEMLATYLEHNNCTVEIRRRLSYHSHEYTMYVDGDELPPFPTEPEYDEEWQASMVDYMGELRAAVIKTCVTPYDREDILEKSLQWARDRARELYRDLEREFEYLTSDESVWEAITTNDLDKEQEPEEICLTNT
jgi:hypothetical protein